MKRPFHSLLIVLLAVIMMMSGCGSGGGSSKKNLAGSDNNPASSGSYIYGVASKGPIRKGFVVVYALNALGNWDEKKALGIPSFTQDDGSFAMDIGNYTGNVLVEVRGETGTYIDEATKEIRNNPRLRAAVTRVNGSVSVMVTPFTEIAVQKALDEGGLTEVNIDNANALVGTVAGGVDIINTTPANVLVADDVAASSPEEISYGLALASISEMVNNNKYAANVPDAINKISDAIRDNNLTAQGENLKSALQAFLNNTNNQSGVTDLSQTNIDESFDLLSNTTLEQESNDINQVFRLLEVMYAAQSPSDTDISGWFDSYIADDYLHDGRIKSDETAVWTGAGGLYQGVSLSAVLLSPMVVEAPFVKGYWIRVSFSGSKGTGSILSSMVYDSANSKWLWYGNRKWGVGLSNFLPRAEMVVNARGDVSFSNGFEVVIWDYNLSAFNHGVKSALITGPGLPADGLILDHYYPQSYFSLYNSDTGYNYPLSDEVINTIPDNAEYTIRFYSESAGGLSLSNLPTPVRTETKTFVKRPFLNSELNASLFPDLTSHSHDLSALKIGEPLGISWTDPADTTVNLVSLSWIDVNGKAQSVTEYPEPATDAAEGPATVTLDTASKPAADLTAELYMRAEDTYGRGVSLTWQYWKQGGSPDEVTAINEIFRSLEGLYATSKSPEDELTAMTEWFNNNAAADYLHDGRDRAKDIEVWTGAGGLDEGISVSAILLRPMDDVTLPAPYQYGYWIKLYFSGPKGSGSILSSVVYDGTRWLWYGNREWGLGLSGFLPWSEKTISGETDPTFDTGFEVIIWDTSLAAYKQGVISAIITGPGLPDDGVKLKHYYTEADPEKTYFSLLDTNAGFSYSLKEQITQIADNSVYTINFYTEPAETENLSQYTPVKTLTRVIEKGPVLKSDLESDYNSGTGLYFPELTAPVSHELADANIPGPLVVNWINPSLMIVNFVSMGWLDSNEGMKYVSAYPAYDAGTQDGHVTLTTEGSAIWFANLYLRGEDSYNRRFSVTWQFSDTTFSTTSTP